MRKFWPFMGDFLLRFEASIKSEPFREIRRFQLRVLFVI